MAAPVGGLLWGFGACALRIGWLWIQAKRKGLRFDAFDRPPVQHHQSSMGGSQEISSDETREEEERQEHEISFPIEAQKGRFY